MFTNPPIYLHRQQNEICNFQTFLIVLSAAHRYESFDLIFYTFKFSSRLLWYQSFLQRFYSKGQISSLLIGVAFYLSDLRTATAKLHRCKVVFINIWSKRCEIYGEGQKIHHTAQCFSSFFSLIYVLNKILILCWREAERKNTIISLFDFWI